MAIFGKIKEHINGGAAFVTLKLNPTCIMDHMPINYIVSIRANSEPIGFNETYLYLRAIESSQTSCKIFEIKETHSESIYILPNQIYEWRGSLFLPKKAPSTYVGKYSKLEWIAVAGIEFSGLNPESDAIPIAVNRPVFFESN